MPELELTQKRCYFWEGFCISWSDPIGSCLKYEFGKLAFEARKAEFLLLLSNAGYTDIDFGSLTSEYEGQGGQCVAFHSLPAKDYLTLLLEHYKAQQKGETLERIREYVTTQAPDRGAEAYLATNCVRIKDAYNALILMDIDEAERSLKNLKAQLLKGGQDA